VASQLAYVSVPHKRHIHLPHLQQQQQQSARVAKLNEVKNVNFICQLKMEHFRHRKNGGPMEAIRGRVASVGVAVGGAKLQLPAVAPKSEDFVYGAPEKSPLPPEA